MASFFARSEAAQRNVAANPAAVRKKARWIENGARYLRGSGVRKSITGQWVQTDPRIHTHTLRLIQAAAPGVADAINQHLIPVADRAFDLWPVATGLSKSTMAVTFDFAQGRLVTSISVNAPYTFFINKGRTARDLVFTPGAAAAEEMAQGISASIARRVR